MKKKKKKKVHVQHKKSLVVPNKSMLHLFLILDHLFLYELDMGQTFCELFVYP